MSLPDYIIIAIVAALFVLALIVYKKKPHCSCGCGGGCGGNCAECRSVCGCRSEKTVHKGNAEPGGRQSCDAKQ